MTTPPSSGHQRRHRFGTGLSHGLAGRRVLVVEDNALIAIMFADDLSDAGAEVVGPVATVEDALRLVDSLTADGGLDAAVLDVNLGGRSVEPVADRLAGCGVPFLFATGYGPGFEPPGHPDRPVLHKPFEAELLLAIMNDLPAPCAPSGCAA
jgi:CheY-like chemotaxis protein